MPRARAPRRTPARLALAAMILAIACKSVVEVCTLIGCEGALTIAFTTPPTVPYQLEAVSVTAGVRDFTCADPTKCVTAALSGYTPDQAIITITTASGSKQFNVTPDYQGVYPNGQRCGAACRNATVTLSLP
jgi:hypothetical protein